jgi:hypothetical protein
MHLKQRTKKKMKEILETSERYQLWQQSTVKATI